MSTRPQPWHDEARRLLALNLTYKAIGDRVGRSEVQVNRFFNPAYAERQRAGMLKWQRTMRSGRGACARKPAPPNLCGREPDAMPLHAEIQGWEAATGTVAVPSDPGALIELAQALRELARLQHVGNAYPIGRVVTVGEGPQRTEERGRTRLLQLRARGWARHDSEGWWITPAGAEAARRLDDPSEGARACA